MSELVSVKWHDGQQKSTMPHYVHHAMPSHLSLISPFLCHLCYISLLLVSQLAHTTSHLANEQPDKYHSNTEVGIMNRNENAVCMNHDKSWTDHHHHHLHHRWMNIRPHGRSYPGCPKIVCMVLPTTTGVIRVRGMTQCPDLPHNPECVLGYRWTPTITSWQIVQIQ